MKKLTEKHYSLDTLTKLDILSITENNKEKIFIENIIKQYELTNVQAKGIYEILQKVSKNSNLSVEEAIKLVKGGKQ